MIKLILQEAEKTIREYPLDKDIMTIGRDKDCDISIDDVGISRQHAKIRKEEEYIIEDTQSSNGTFVNNSKIEKYVLKNNDKIRIGKYTLIYKGEEKELPSEESDKTMIIPAKEPSTDEDATRVLAPRQSEQTPTKEPAKLIDTDGNIKFFHGLFPLSIIIVLFSLLEMG